MTAIIITGIICGTVLVGLNWYLTHRERFHDRILEMNKKTIELHTKQLEEAAKRGVFALGDN